MEITTMTFVTLSILLICAIYIVITLFKSLADHEHLHEDHLNKPLKNIDKPWYNN